jgi:demethylmenaquinone methyltransferase/2-methoxy-6-polyprenyl-1,4-benzoquinol methylase
MTNKYLSYDAERAPKVRAMFSRLAEKYDLVNDVMSFGLHRRWKRETVLLATQGMTRPLRWLDLCCGTGDIGFLAERTAARGSQIVGADFTLAMLAVAQRRARGEAKTVAFVEADALRLPFRDGAFEVITVGYGLRNLADPAAGLVEMRRVLAPGGRAVILDFGKPENPVAALLYRAFLHTMMPAVGLLFHGDADTYLYIPASLERYPAQRGVAELMRGAGFANAHSEDRLLGTMGINVGEAPESRKTGDGRR